VDLRNKESFGFLGFDYRQLRSIKRGAWRAHYTPKLKKRTALLRTLETILRRSRSQPVQEIIQQINPILRGWVNYFAAGHASRCFTYIRDWRRRCAGI
jgi:RNA-directed DNA polymerase